MEQLKAELNSTQEVKFFLVSMIVAYLSALEILGIENKLLCCHITRCRLAETSAVFHTSNMGNLQHCYTMMVPCFPTFMCTCH